ncbi:hypothetical protein Tco_1489647 [Tanacetum coccineum]
MLRVKKKDALIEPEMNVERRGVNECDNDLKVDVNVRGLRRMAWGTRAPSNGHIGSQKGAISDDLVTEKTVANDISLNSRDGSLNDSFSTDITATIAIRHVCLFVGIKRLLDDIRVTAAKVCVTTAK